MLLSLAFNIEMKKEELPKESLPGFSPHITIPQATGDVRIMDNIYKNLGQKHMLKPTTTPGS